MSIIIEKIVFENYRQYGSGTLNFSNKGNRLLSVLIAKNGTGKTTVLNAITWCLYGQELHLTDSKTALPLINSAIEKRANPGENIPVSVAVNIHDRDIVIEFKREVFFKVSADSEGKNRLIEGDTKLTATITPIHNFENTTIKQGVDADVIVKQYFDEAIFKFYFFDGEKLRDFFTTNQANSIKQSIFNISQVTLLENACNHLEKMYNEKIRKIEKESPNIQPLNIEREKLEKNIKTAENTLIEQKKIIEILTNKRKDLDEILRGYEPIKKMHKERLELENKNKNIEAEERTLRTKRAEFIRKYIVLIALYPRIKTSYDLISKKEMDGDLPPAIDKEQVIKLLEHPKKKCPLCNSEVNEDSRNYLKNLLKEIAVSSKTSNYLKEIKGPLEAYIDQVHLFRKNLAELNQEEIDISARKENVLNRLKEIMGVLTNFESKSDEVNVSKIEEERSTINREINLANQDIGSAKETIILANKKLEKINCELNNAIQTSNIHKEIKKQIKLIRVLIENFASIKDSIMHEMKEEIQYNTWNYFDSMIWKNNTFGEIKISENYQVDVFNKDRVKMTGSLSATEQMALAYAFTLAIHKASGKNCPLVIDSPLGRVSDDNRENMARSLLEVSKDKQIIMLFTPDEYSESVKNIYNNVAEVRKISLSEDESYIERIDLIG